MSESGLGGGGGVVDPSLGERRAASVNDRTRGPPPAYDAGMLRRLLLLALLLLPAAAPAAPAIDVGEIRACAPAGPCRAVDLRAFALEGREMVIEREVRIAPAAQPLPRPLMVYVFAMASSEIRWNGVAIGRNGVPGPTPSGEIPGRFIATFTVPAALVRPGDQPGRARGCRRITSGCRCAGPSTSSTSAITKARSLPGLTGYLPALLALGVLAAAALYFGAAAWLDRRDRQVLLLAAIAVAAILQLGVETARSFVNYAYPWHLVRVAAVALLAAVTAVLIAAYAARRFEPSWRRSAPALTAAVVARRPDPHPLV